MKRFYAAVGVCVGWAVLLAVCYLYFQGWNPDRAGPARVDLEEQLPFFGDRASANQIIHKYDRWFSRDFSAEKRLLDLIRKSLADDVEVKSVPRLSVDLEPAYAWVAVSLFQEGADSIRWISKRQTPVETINRILEKLREHKDFSRFEVRDANRCRIMLEIITDQRPLDIERLTGSQFSDSRFEPGITGFCLRYKGRRYYYMPTDAVVESHLSAQHALKLLSKKIGVADQTDRISERIEMLKELPIEWGIIESVGFISYGDEVLPLYRGYPMPVRFSTDRISEMTRRSVDWVYDNMTEAGQFLYYYDAVRDSVIDHAHPSRSIEDNYYNILRHSGGVITLLRAYELTGDKKYVTASKRALEFLLRHVRRHDYKGRDACYVFYNEKAKLGGTGIGLAALVRYYQSTGDAAFNDYIFGMANHLLSRIDKDGEMIGYYIHPEFNDGGPITAPSAEQKRQLFSFYYPGEALLGLALFERAMDMSDELRAEVRDGAQRALDFLVKLRPVRYAEMFRELPSDGWLMQAIEEWACDEQFRKKDYLDFVFNDANQMVFHMYNERNSPYYDYPGMFFYNYGDHAYPDGARAEGLIAAYYLAKRLGREQLAQVYLENCVTVARALMHTYNSPESAYMHRFPHKSIGSFRFKLTRHWVRVDTVQHTACFYVRLLSAMEQLED